jgi:putative transposase
MGDSTTTLKTYKYRLYRCDKKDRKLRHKIFVASTIWNHFIALQKRYYKLTKKYIRLDAMNRHVLKLRHRPKFALWRELHSQACQNVCRRIDDAYLRFFNQLVKRLPKFKKAKKYSSFTFPQSGYKVEGSTVTIDGVRYKFVKHREMAGTIKTLTVKRDKIGRLWLVFSLAEQLVIPQASMGKISGFDFGLKDFLVNDEGKRYKSPEFYRRDLRKIRKANQKLSRKVEGSKRYNRARRGLARMHIRVADKRRDAQFKLSHELCDENAILCFEDLNLQGMKAMWGRKVSDLAFGQFIIVLEWVSEKRGKTVVKIDWFTPTTKICSACGQVHSLTLRDRTLHCDCGLVIDRDHNAAINIKRAGASAHYKSASKTQVRLRGRVDGRSPRL